MDAAGDMEAQLLADIELLRRDPAAIANWLRANRQNLYKGTELELLKDDLKTKVLLATHDGRKACLAAISALDKARGLKPFEAKKGLSAVAAATAADMASGKGKTSTSVQLMDELKKHGNFKSTPKVEFNADRIVLFGPDMYTARNILASALINDGVADARARNALLSTSYQYLGCSVMKHPTQEYVAVITLATPVWEDK